MVAVAVGGDGALYGEEGPAEAQVVAGAGCPAHTVPHKQGVGYSTCSGMNTTQAAGASEHTGTRNPSPFLAALLGERLKPYLSLPPYERPACMDAWVMRASAWGPRGGQRMPWCAPERDLDRVPRPHGSMRLHAARGPSAPRSSTHSLTEGLRYILPTALSIWGDWQAGSVHVECV